MDILLKNWGLLDLCDIFQANDIKSVHELNDLLHEANSSDLIKIIPSITTRMKLRKCFAEYTKTNKADTENICNQVAESVYGSILLDLTDVPQTDPLIVIEDTDISNPTTSKSNNWQAVDTSIRIKETESKDLHEERNNLYIKTVHFDLKEVLSKNAYGNTLLLINAYKGNITTQCQSILCDIIVSFFLNLNIRTLQNEDFDKIANEIVHLFPNECKDTYYMPPIRKKDSRHDKAGVSRGKLVDKFRNALRFIRSGEKLQDNRYQKRENLTDQADEDTIAEQNRIWLIHNHQPQEEVDKKWDASYILRVHDCASKVYKNVNDIFIKWPILKVNSGYLLVYIYFDPLDYLSCY